MTNNPQPNASLPGRIVRRRMGRFDWLIIDTYQNAAWLRRLEQPETMIQPPAEPLKKAAPGWEVVRVRLDDPATADLAVKHSTPRGLVEFLKWSWRGSPATRAFHLARHIQALGFFTASPIAAGERRAWGMLCESFLLTRFVADATPLHLVNAHCADRRRRLGIVRELAKLYAAMHDAGFYHCDPSQANFLVVGQPSGGDAVALIDLDGLRQRKEVSLIEAAHDLRRLLMRCRIPRRERAWFITVYTRSRKIRLEVRSLVKTIGLPPAQATFPYCALNEEGLPDATARASVTAPASLTSSRFKTPFPNGLERHWQVHTTKSGGLLWRVRCSLLGQDAQTILDAPDEFLKRARVLKPSRSSGVSAQDGLVLKRYNFRKWRNLLKDLFRGSKARRCFFRGIQLELAGVPTARPLAFAEHTCCGVPLRSYLLMDEIPQATTLFAWRGDKRRTIQALARLLARLHNAGFTHRDLKEGNILFDGSGKPFLVDLDGLRYVRHVEDKWVMADLARLAQAVIAHDRATRTDLARFLQAYCLLRRRDDWQSLWRVINQRRGPEWLTKQGRL
jgi:tRNA A-37 threonylcarbamoyl transferase component Bud32